MKKYAVVLLLLITTVALEYLGVDLPAVAETAETPVLVNRPVLNTGSLKKDGALCSVSVRSVFDNGMKHNCFELANTRSVRGAAFRSQDGCKAARSSATNFTDNSWTVGFNSNGRGGRCDSFLPINHPDGNVFFRTSQANPLSLKNVTLELDYQKREHPCQGSYFDWFAVQMTRQSNDPDYPAAENLVTRFTLKPELDGEVKRAKYFVAIKGVKYLNGKPANNFVLGLHLLRTGKKNERYKDIPSLVTARQCRPEEPCDESMHLLGSHLGYELHNGEETTLEIDWDTVLKHATTLQKNGKPLFAPYEQVEIRSIRVGMEPTGASNETHKLTISNFELLSKDTRDCQ